MTKVVLKTELQVSYLFTGDFLVYIPKTNKI